MKIVIYEEIDQGKEFYSIMGEFFAFRDYAHEMGGWQFYNKKKSIWFLAYIDNNLVGFCAAFENSTHIFWDNFYIIKKYRGKGYSKILIDKRLKFTLRFKKEIRAITDNPLQIDNYKKIGMISYGMRGRYTKFKMENK